MTSLPFSLSFSALEYSLDIDKLNLSAIRTVRVLRPLRAINRIPSEKLHIYEWNLFHKSTIGLKQTRNFPIHCDRSFPLGMRILVMLLLDTLPMLGNVLLLCFFVFFIFGIVGVQLWAGLLRQRCYIPEEQLMNIRNSQFYR